MKKHHLTLVVATSLLIPTGAQASTISVLWTSGTTTYNDNISELATEASSFDPDGDGGLNWDLTFWDASAGTGPAGGFGSYDVLTIGSTCNFSGTGNCGGSNGFFSNGVFVDGITSLGAEIENARGSRTFLSGQDADWHDLNNRPDQDNGPKGFMINAVNWAASGTGMGIVSMTDRYLNSDGWWTAPGSFLADEIPAGSAFPFQSDAVNLGAGQEDFPINEGLTSAGLSNWSTSSHACFNDISGFTRINFAPQGGSVCGVTIVTSGTEGGGTSGGNEDNISPIPLPAAGWLLLAGLGILSALRRRG